MLLRTMLYVPGNRTRMIQKARELPADAIILDLEDAVPISEKKAARISVRDSIEQLSTGKTTVFVRVNAVSTGMTGADLEETVRPGLRGIVLPKTESRAHIREAEEMIASLESVRRMERGSVMLIPLVETAAGIMNLTALAGTSQRIAAIAFGAVDFAHDLGIGLSPTATMLLYARSHISLASAASGVQAIDSPWVDFGDLDGLVQESERSRHLGFQGKQVIHPDQVEPVNSVFSPSEAELAHAEKVIHAFREADRQGLGVAQIAGVMVDAASFRHAKRIVAKAETITQQEHARRLTAL